MFTQIAFSGVADLLRPRDKNALNEFFFSRARDVYPQYDFARMNDKEYGATLISACKSELLSPFSRALQLGNLVGQIAANARLRSSTMAVSQFYRLRLSTADPLSLCNRTVCDLPCKTMLITPEIPYSLL